MAESNPYVRRGFEGGATRTTLSSDISDSAATISCTNLSSWAGATTNGPITATINRGQSDEEVVEATGISSNDLTGVTRGVGGTSAVAHSSGASVELTSRDRDFDEANYWVAELAAAISAAESLVVSDGDNSLIELPVAASRFVGRKASGSVAAMTVAEAKTLLAITGADITAGKVEIVVACSDETTTITTGTKVTFRMPYAMTVTAVRASLTTASTSGAVTVDINDGGTTILSTALTLDQDEKTSTTAATPAVISDSALADDAEVKIDVDGAGTGAKGLKVTLIGTRA